MAIDIRDDRWPLDARAFKIGLSESRRSDVVSVRLRRLVQILFGVGFAPARLADPDLEAIRRIGIERGLPEFDLAKALDRLRDNGFDERRIAAMASQFRDWPGSKAGKA